MSFLDTLLRQVRTRFGTRATIQNLLSSTPDPFFYRSQRLLRPRYLGFKFDFEQRTIGNMVTNWIRRIIGSQITVVYVSLFFLQKSADKPINYLVIVRVPYMKDMDSYRIQDLPVQYYCECLAFKFYIAYALYKVGNLYFTDTIKKRLGIALVQPPVIKNPKEIRFFCKHGISVVRQLQGRRVSQFLSSQYHLKE